MDNSSSFDKKIYEIIKFIKKSSIIKIKDELENIIYYNKYCPNIIGKGKFGKVFIQNTNNSIITKINNKDLDLPIVIKETYNDNNVDNKNTFNINDNKLYISSLKTNLLSELLILIYIKQLYNKTVNLPLLLGYGTCNNSKLVNRIIILKYGLENNIEFKKFNNQTIYSYLSTFDQLFHFINYYKKNNSSITFPNGEKCNSIPVLFDYITLSYLINHIFLVKNNIYLRDMHASNIFINWLNDKSYFNNKCIKNIKEIIYKINNKYYKIKTFGFVPIIGDTGCFEAKLKKNLYLNGCFNEKSNFTFKESALIFYIWNKDLLTNDEFKKTICYKILNSKPFNNLNISGLSDYLDLAENDEKIAKKIISNEEMLSLYEFKYGIDKYIKKDDNILIDLD